MHPWEEKNLTLKKASKRLEAEFHPKKLLWHATSCVKSAGKSLFFASHHITCSDAWAKVCSESERSRSGSAAKKRGRVPSRYPLSMPLSVVCVCVCLYMCLGFGGLFLSLWTSWEEEFITSNLSTAAERFTGRKLSEIIKVFQPEPTGLHSVDDVDDGIKVLLLLPLLRASSNRKQHEIYLGWKFNLTTSLPPRKMGSTL